MKRSRRIFCLVVSLILMISFAVSVTGCSLREFFNESSNGGNGTVSDVQVLSEESRSYTNDQWLEMVNDAFGAQTNEGETSLDVAKKYGFVDENISIDPDAPLNNQLATTSMMRAAGLVSPDATDEEVIKAAAERGIITADSDMTNPEKAQEALRSARYEWMYQEVTPHEDIVFQENVTDLTENDDAIAYKIIKTDNGTGVQIPEKDTENFKEGSVVILPCENYKSGKAFKVEKIIPGTDKTATVIVSEPTIDDVYDKFDVGGTFASNSEDVEVLNENVTLIKNDPVIVMDPVSFDCSEEPVISNLSNSFEDCITPLADIDKELHHTFNGCEFVCWLDDNGNLLSSDGGIYKVSVRLSDIELTGNYFVDLKLIGEDIINCYTALDYKSTVSFTNRDGQEFSTDDSPINNNAKFEKTFELITIPIEIAPGFSVRVVANLVIGLSGNVSIELSTDHHIGFTLTNQGGLQTFNESEPDSLKFAVSARLSAYLELGVTITFDVLDVDLVKLTIDVGPVVTGKAAGNISFKEDSTVCFDIHYYLSLKIDLDLEKHAMKLLKDPKLYFELLKDNEKNPVRGTVHAEFKNGKFQMVPECTVKDEQTAEQASQKIYQVNVGKLLLEHSLESVGKGKTLRLMLKSMPAGVQMSDLEWTSSDPNVISVDQYGNVTALTDSGNAVITVSVNQDGKKSTYSCAVSANDSDIQETNENEKDDLKSLDEVYNILSSIRNTYALNKENKVKTSGNVASVFGYLNISGNEIKINEKGYSKANNVDYEDREHGKLKIKDGKCVIVESTKNPNFVSYPEKPIYAEDVKSVLSRDKKTSFYRHNCAECKLIENVAGLIETKTSDSKNVTGSLEFYTEIKPCDSCGGEVFTHFSRDYPKLKILVYDCEGDGNVFEYIAGSMSVKRQGTVEEPS